MKNYITKRRRRIKTYSITVWYGSLHYERSFATTSPAYAIRRMTEYLGLPWEIFGEKDFDIKYKLVNNRRGWEPVKFKNLSWEEMFLINKNQTT